MFTVSELNDRHFGRPFCRGCSQKMHFLGNASATGLIACACKLMDASLGIGELTFERSQVLGES